MSTTVIAGIVGLIALMVTGIPVAFSFMGAALIMSVLGHYNTSFMVASGFAKMSSITLLAMPMYILAGSLMEFGGIKLARDLFDGNVNAVACIGEGSIKMGGNISMIDNVNRILDRVALYLA